MTCRWAALAFVLALCGPAVAADWPARPIKIIAPSTPGGAADSFARLLADRMGPLIGGTIIVENRTGGGGLVGVATTARAEPDGYSLVMSSAAYNTIEPFVSPNPGFDPARDFTHIAYVGGQANTFIVSAKVGWQSLKDVIDAARSGKTVDFVTPGVGTVGHLLMESFASAAGIKLQHIPHRGASQAMLDLVGGTVPLGTMTWSSAIGQIRAKTVKPVAVSSSARVPEFPDVPTLRDLGFDLMADSWFGLSGPAGMPPEIVAKLNAAVATVMSAPDVRAKLAGDAITPSSMSPAEFSAYVAADIAKWQPLVRQLGLGH